MTTSLTNQLKSSTRAEIIERRTYLRPLNDDGTVFETFEQSIDRQIGHQRWLWEQAKAGMTKDEKGEVVLEPLDEREEEELEELKGLMLERKITLSGRVSWLGGTDVIKKRQSAAFNCSFIEVETVYDVVDVLWLLLQGCGVGFRPIIGTLNGFMHEIPEVEVVRSVRTAKGGVEHNVETFDRKTGVWAIKVGDSAEAWAKSIGKLLAGKYPAKKLVLDFSEVRPAGERLKGYGWISSGDEQIAKAYVAIAAIMNKAAGKLLTRMNILDIVNWLGTVLSSRRSAEICLIPFGEPEWEEFAVAKKDAWNGNTQRYQSNNTLVFYSKPERHQLRHVFQLMEEAGGSEPGFANGEAALKRAPWFKGMNPCLTGDTYVMTLNGQRQIIDLVDNPFVAQTKGNLRASGGFWKSGTKKVYKVTTEAGYSFRATDNHGVYVVGQNDKVEVKDLTCDHELLIETPYSVEWGEKGQENIGWTLGEIVGNGGFNYAGKYHAYARFWGEDQAERAQWVFELVGDIPTDYQQPVAPEAPVKNSSNNTTQVQSRKLTELCETWLDYGKTISPKLEKASSSMVAGFLRGYFDADGSVQGELLGHGVSIRLTSINIHNLYAVQRMLLSLGILSKVYAERQSEGERLLPDGKGGNKLYNCAPVGELIISRAAVDVYAKRVGFYHPEKARKLQSIIDSRKRPAYANRTSTKVVSVEFDGIEDVYDCTVDVDHTFSANGIRVSNCGEVLLGNRNVCNLAESVLNRFNGDFKHLLRAHYILARANYRQTCVDFVDGILQRSWHELNEYLRLCGAGVTGVVAWEGQDVPEMWESLREAAHDGAYSMADELGMPRPKNVTTIKPSGTKSKANALVGQEIPEGVHKPLGRYIFNNTMFSAHDPMVKSLQDAGYRWFQHPNDPTSVIVTIPIEYSNIPFDKVKMNVPRQENVYVGDGDFRTEEYIEEVDVEVNLESALTQLERYKTTMLHYNDQNTSVTISYDPTEVEDIIDWFMDNWDHYVGVSFIYRNDPTKTAEDFGYQYLPQVVVDAQTYHDYVDSLKTINWEGSESELEVDSGADCATGACPVR